MDAEVRLIGVKKGAGQEIAAEVYFWEEDPDNKDFIRVLVRIAGKEITASAEDYFSALVTIRHVLEEEGLLIACYGSSRNVYPSPMLQSMGNGLRAYKLALGLPARQSDIVNIFDTDPDVEPAMVHEQEAFYKDWLSSLK